MLRRSLNGSTKRLTDGSKLGNKQADDRHAVAIPSLAFMEMVREVVSLVILRGKVSLSAGYVVGILSNSYITFRAFTNYCVPAIETFAMTQHEQYTLRLASVYS